VNELAQSRIPCWVFISVALEFGVIRAEVQNIVVFIVYLFMVYLTTMSVALLW
jgi:hypothetical protein